jgi:hypothetical protein
MLLASPASSKIGAADGGGEKLDAIFASACASLTYKRNRSAAMRRACLGTIARHVGAIESPAVSLTVQLLVVPEKGARHADATRNLRAIPEFPLSFNREEMQ